MNYFRNLMRRFSTQNSKIPKKTKPYNQNKKEIPERFKAPLKAISQVQNFQVASQAQTQQTQLKRVIEQQRSKLSEKDKTDSSQFLVKIFGIITTTNVVGFTVASLTNKVYVGMWLCGILHPSYILSNAILIGCSISQLIMRHSLYLHLSNSDFKKQKQIQLIGTNFSNVLHSLKIGFDLTLLVYLSQQILLQGTINDLLYVLLSASVIYQTFKIIPQNLINWRRNFKLILLLYSLIYGMYMITLFFDKDQLQTGMKIIQQKLVSKKLKVQKGVINKFSDDLQ